MVATNGYVKTGVAKKKLTTKPKTAKYRPTYTPTIFLPQWGLPGGFGAFTLDIVEQMKHDPQVALCLEYKHSPIFTAEFDIQASSDTEKKFVWDNLERFWQKSLPFALESTSYGYMAGEAIYKADNGRIVFDGLKPIHPRDAKVWTDAGRLDFIRVHNRVNSLDKGVIDLRGATDDLPAKGVWFVHDAKWNPWYGRSACISAWWPWRLKTMPDGGMEVAFKWAYKQSIPPTIVRHPNKLYETEDENDGEQAQDIARQMGESLKACGVIAMPSEKYSSEQGGHEMWGIEWGQTEKGGSSKNLLEWVEFLNKEIQRGFLIPDEVITHQGNTGGYSRSQVAASAFFVAAEQQLHCMLEAFDDQVLRPLVRCNFGKDTYRVKPKPLLPPDQQQQQQQQGDMPGQQPQPDASGMIPFTGKRGGQGKMNPVTGQKMYGQFSQLDLSNTDPKDIYQQVRQIVREKLDMARGTEWIPWVGPRGGRGWQSTRTGRVVYGPMPGSRDHHGPDHEEPEPKTKVEELAGTGVKELREPESDEDMKAWLAEAMEHPHIKEAQRQIDENFDAEDTEARWDKLPGSTPKKPIWNAERVAKVHKPILRHFINDKARPPAGEKPKAFFLIGPFGAGKSVAGQPIVNQEMPNYTMVNPDEIKEMMPENKGWNASQIHEESSYLSKQIQKHAINRGHNILFDGSGQNSKKMADLATELNSKGYDVHMVHVTVPKHVSAHRAAQRFLSNPFGAKDKSQAPGRYAPLGYVYNEVGSKPDDTYKMLKEHPGIASWRSFSTHGVPKPVQTDNGSRPPQSPHFISENVRKAAGHAQDIAKEWQEKLGPLGVKVVMGGSLVSGLALPAKVHDMDVRFLYDGDRKEMIPKIEQATGLKFRKTITVGGGGEPESDGHMIEGEYKRGGLKFDVEGALRNSNYTGWAKFYPEVMSPEELREARDKKEELRNDKKAYKAYKNGLLEEVKKRAKAKGLV